MVFFILQRKKWTEMKEWTQKMKEYNLVNFAHKQNFCPNWEPSTKLKWNTGKNHWWYFLIVPESNLF